MSQKTRVLNVRVVGFSAPERQMLNSIFLLSVAPARQIGYKLWNSESGAVPDMYLLDGDSESAVASWQAAFNDAVERTLVVGSRNTDLGCASAARPLGLKVVGAMDRLAIALNNIQKEAAGFHFSGPGGGTLPTGPTCDTAATMPMKQPDPRAPQVPTLSSSMAAAISSGAPLSATLTANGNPHAMTPGGTLPTSMTAAAPAATVLPAMSVQPTLAPAFERTINERAADKILSDKSGFDKGGWDRPTFERPAAPSLPPISGATPLSPSALAAAVAPTPRANLRVVSAPQASLAASLPSVASAAARIADAPMNQPFMPPPAAAAARIADAPMNQPFMPPPAAPAARIADAPMNPPVMPPPAAPATRIADAPVNPPVMQPPAAPASVMQSSAPRQEEPTFRVLTVDDSPLMRTFLQNKLAPYGINPEFAASGEEALYKISKQHFDLIFLDVMLPGMDGYDVCKAIKKNKNKDKAAMRVVMLTSKDKTFDKIRGTMAGCDGYLTKPVDEMKLRAIIERHSDPRK